jgi:hypothetical protein
MTNFRPTTLSPEALKVWDEAEANIQASLQRIRELTSPPAPARTGSNAMTNTDFRALCAELLAAWQKGDDIFGPMNRARALLAEPEAEGAPLSLVTNCHISGPAPKPFTHWSDYFNHVQQSGVISGLKIEATLPTPEAND